MEELTIDGSLDHTGSQNEEYEAQSNENEGVLEEQNASTSRLPRLPSAHLSRSVLETHPDSETECLDTAESMSRNSPNEAQGLEVEIPSEATVTGTELEDPKNPEFVLLTELRDSDSILEEDTEVEITDVFIDEPNSTKPVTVQLDDDEMWDTDLDIDDEGEEHDPTGRAQYRSLCDELGVVPISYFIRHITQTEITMKYHGLGQAGAKAIALVLRDNVTLERLNLDGNWIGGEGGQAMGRMLEDNDYITEISLCGNRLESMGAESMCKMLLTNAGLRKINLADNNFTDTDTPVFIDCLEHNKYLRELNLSRNHFGQSAGELWGPAIGSNDILKSLDLSWNHLRLKGGIAVARGLQENVGLKWFSVAWNGLGPECGQPFAEAIANNSSLDELDLSGNRLDITSALAIAKALLSNDEIKTLRIGNNLLSTSGAVALITAINNNESSAIQLLDLTDVPVEFEFLRVIEDIRMKRPDFKAIHGPVLRSGNTSGDIGKPAIDPYRRKEPVLVLQEHIVVNDLRLVDILKRYDTDKTFSVTPAEFLSSLDELAVPYNRKNLEKALKHIPRGNSGKIHFGDFYDEENRPISSGAIMADGNVEQEQ